MATNFGADANAIVQDQQGNIKTGGVSYTVWDSQTGGTQITNLLDGAGSPWPGGVIQPDSRGRLIFSDPTDTYLLVWVESVDTPSDPRIAIMSRDVGPVLQQLILDGATAIPLAQKGAPSGVATLDASSVIPIAQIPASVMTDADKDIAGGVAGLDGSGLMNPVVLPNVDAALYLRHRQGVWDLERERVVRGLSATDYSLTFAAIFADAGFRDGDIIEVRNGTYPLLTKVVVNRQCTIQGKGGQSSVFTTSANIRMFEVTASNVTFEKIGLTGPGAATYNAASFGIYAVGTSAASPIENLTVRRCRITLIAANAIQTEFVNYVNIEFNTIANIVRAGAMILSGDGCKFNRNIFDTATNGTGNPSSNGYAVAFSRNTTVDIATQPRCTNFEAIGNIVKNIPHWEGIDTHAGIYGTIAGNFIFNCDNPIAVVSSAGAVIASEFAPHRVTVRDNHMDSTVTDGSRKPGITFDGAGTGSPGSYAELSSGCVCSGNTVIGHGRENTSSSGGMVATYTTGLRITENRFYECSPSAISIAQDNYGLVIEANNFRDWWTFNVSGTMANPAIVFFAANGDAIVNGNIFERGTKSVTPPAIVNTRGIRIGNTTPNPSVTIGVNNMKGVTTPLQDLGATKAVLTYTRDLVLMGEAAVSSNVNVGPGATLSSWTDLGGASVTFATKNVNARVLVVMTLAGTISTVQSGSRIMGRLMVDGVAETEVASVAGTSLGTSSAVQTYIVTLAASGNHTLKLQGQHNAGGGGTMVGQILATDTKFTYFVMDGA